MNCSICRFLGDIYFKSRMYTFIYNHDACRNQMADDRVANNSYSLVSKIIDYCGSVVWE